LTGQNTSALAPDPAARHAARRHPERHRHRAGPHDPAGGGESGADRGALLLGAGGNQAIENIRRDALRSGLIAVIKAVATAGIVSLPGMMSAFLQFQKPLPLCYKGFLTHIHPNLGRREWPMRPQSDQNCKGSFTIRRRNADAAAILVQGSRNLPRHLAPVVRVDRISVAELARDRHTGLVIAQVTKSVCVNAFPR
jgi:hypothetical protein